LKQQQGFGKMTLSTNDKIFIMTTTMLEAAEDLGLEREELKIVETAKAWYVVEISTGRGVARVLNNEF
tara:strand:- start:351 stop:554 length:204 start_codon:yes stop_codon:yes gene_type:complete